MYRLLDTPTMPALNRTRLPHARTGCWKPALAAIGALALGACVTIPKPLAGAYVQLSPRNAAGGHADGTRVRWGGDIIKTSPEANHTCFEVLARALDSSNARPVQGGASEGRFIACHKGFFDPEVYAKGREVTFTGTIDGIITRKVGDYDYAYPRLDADTVYLWPKRVPVRYYYPPAYYDPFWPGPWFYGPAWYGPPVVVRPHYHSSCCHHQPGYEPGGR